MRSVKSGCLARNPQSDVYENGVHFIASAVAMRCRIVITVVTGRSAFYTKG